MPTILPPARPRLSRDQALDILDGQGFTTPALLGIRGYYRDTMGLRGENDVGLYDDLIAIVTGEYAAYNANTDPSRLHWNVAVLTPGRWDYKLGIHGITKPPDRRYRALVQAGPVTVRRHDGDEGGDVYESGWFGINIHRGGYNTTSSEGCQTIHPDQWPEFLELVELEMGRLGLPTIPYVLVDNPARV